MLCEVFSTFGEFFVAMCTAEGGFGLLGEPVVDVGLQVVQPRRTAEGEDMLVNGLQGFHKVSLLNVVEDLVFFFQLLLLRFKAGKVLHV